MRGCVGVTTKTTVVTPKKENGMTKFEEQDNLTHIKGLQYSPGCIKDQDSQEDDSKFSMEKLCQKFLQTYKRHQNTIFDTKTLLIKFAVKQRRIYDLMNIMQGCGCVKKISKGQYQWLGFKQSEFLKPQNQRGQSTSLRQIAARIKLLLFETGQPLLFSQIYTKLLEENQSKNINPASIRRRIYECCKVLKILGFIIKIGKEYKWITAQQKSLLMQYKNPIRKQKKIRSLLIMNQNNLLEQILNRCKSQDDLKRIILKLHEKFEIRQYKNQL